MDNLSFLAFLWRFRGEKRKNECFLNSALFCLGHVSTKKTKTRGAISCALGGMRSLELMSATARETKVKPKKKEAKRSKTNGKKHMNFIRRIFHTHNRHTHTHARAREWVHARKRRLFFDFFSVKRRRRLRRSTLYSVLQERLYSLSSKSESAHFWKSKGERDEQHRERDDDDRQ